MPFAIRIREEENHIFFCFSFHSMVDFIAKIITFECFYLGIIQMISFRVEMAI